MKISFTFDSRNFRDFAQNYAKESAFSSLKIMKNSENCHSRSLFSNCLPFGLSRASLDIGSFSPMADCKKLSISFAYLSTHWHALTHAKDPIQLSSSCYVLLSQYPLQLLTNSRTSYSENTSEKVEVSWFHQIHLVFVLKIECLRSFFSRWQFSFNKSSLHYVCMLK